MSNNTTTDTCGKCNGRTAEGEAAAAAYTAERNAARAARRAARAGETEVLP